VIGAAVAVVVSGGSALIRNFWPSAVTWWPVALMSVSTLTH
jgi:hypothetical protein